MSCITYIALKRPPNVIVTSHPIGGCRSSNQKPVPNSSSFWGYPTPGRWRKSLPDNLRCSPVPIFFLTAPNVRWKAIGRGISFFTPMSHLFHLRFLSPAGGGNVRIGGRKCRKVSALFLVSLRFFLHYSIVIDTGYTIASHIVCSLKLTVAI